MPVIPVMPEYPAIADSVPQGCKRAQIVQTAQLKHLGLFGIIDA